MSGWVGVGGFEKGEFEGNRATEKVAAHRRARADPVQLRAQESVSGALFRLQIEASIKFLRKCELVHTGAN
jgi:hypothetical protein